MLVRAKAVSLPFLRVGLDAVQAVSRSRHQPHRASICRVLDMRTPRAATRTHGNTHGYRR